MEVNKLLIKFKLLEEIKITNIGKTVQREYRRINFL